MKYQVVALKTLLKNATIYDGTGSEAYVGDVLIEGEKIISVSSYIDGEAEQIIDLSGSSLAASGKAKELAACNSQTASPLGCLIKIFV